MNAAAEGGPPGYLEADYVCGFWTERLLTTLYHATAGRPDERRLAGLAGVERVAFTTKDRRKLGGYKLRAHAPEGSAPRGYILVAPGNAMLADQILTEFRFLQGVGFDVYIYDYRGYGISEGRSRFFAIQSDQIELIEDLNRRGYANRFVYGMSIGGVFLLGAIGAGVQVDAALIDSSPSRISNYGCAPRFDPVHNLPQDSSRLGFIFGRRDSVVPPEAWRELSDTARSRGAFVLEHSDLSHPMMDADLKARQARFQAIKTFFAERAN